MKMKTKHVYKIYDTEKEEWLSQFSWNASYVVWDKNVNKAKKWGTAKTLSEHFTDIAANGSAEDFNEIPATWQIRKFEITSEINELEDDVKTIKLFISEQLRWPHLNKFWQYPFHEWQLKFAIGDLPKTFNPKFAIIFEGGAEFNAGVIKEKFNIKEVRSLLIKAKKRMTGEMRVLLRYRVVFVSNEDDLSIIKLMLNENITYILNMDTGLDPAGKEIEIEDQY